MHQTNPDAFHRTARAWTLLYATGAILPDAVLGEHAALTADVAATDSGGGSGGAADGPEED